MFPIGLRNAIEAGKAILFIGAGIGYSAHNAAGKRMPVGWELAKELADEFKIAAGDRPSLGSV